MSEIRYLVSRPDGSHSRPVSIGQAKRAVRRQQMGRGPEWRIRRRGDEWGSWRKDFSPSLDRMFGLIQSKGQVGDVYAMDSLDYPYTTTVRIIELSPPLIQTVGNAKIDAIYTFVVSSYTVRSGGICNRRPIDGTTTWSQHAPWPTPDEGANAFDYFQDTMEQLYESAAAIVKEAIAGRLEVGRVIVGAKQWTPLMGWHEYTGIFHRHVHVEGAPTRTGEPKAGC